MTLDWKSTTEMTRDLLAAKYLCILCLGAIVVDFAHSISFDYHLLKDRRKSSRTRWPLFCYFSTKIIYFPYWIVTFMTGEPSTKINCQATIITSEVMMALITCMCSAMLAVRAMCVWEQHNGKVLKYILLFSWLAMFSFWMASILDVKGRWVPGIGSPWIADKGTCIFEPIPFHYASKFVVAVAFDLFILVLTIVGVAKCSGRSRIGQALIEQGIIYFTVTVIVNVLLIIFAWSKLNDVMTVILSVPAQTISIMAATRLYVLLCQKTRSVNKSFQSNSSLPSVSSPRSRPIATSSISSSPFPSSRMKSSTEDTLVSIPPEGLVAFSPLRTSIRPQTAPESLAMSERRLSHTPTFKRPVLKYDDCFAIRGSEGETDNIERMVTREDDDDPYGGRPFDGLIRVKGTKSICEAPIQTHRNTLITVMEENSNRLHKVEFSRLQQAAKAYQEIV